MQRRNSAKTQTPAEILRGIWICIAVCIGSIIMEYLELQEDPMDITLLGPGDRRPSTMGVAQMNKVAVCLLFVVMTVMFGIVGMVSLERYKQKKGKTNVITLILLIACLFVAAVQLILMIIMTLMMFR